MTRSDTPVHIRRLARLSPRWRVTLTALFLLASSGASAFAQNYTFDARRVALGGAGGTPNVASKLVERQRRYKSIMIPVGLLKVLSNVRVFFPTHEDFDFSRAVEFGYSPLHHVFGRGEDLRPSRFFKDLRNATLERDLNAYRGFDISSSTFAEGLVSPNWGKIFMRPT